MLSMAVSRMSRVQKSGRIIDPDLPFFSAVASDRFRFQTKDFFCSGTSSLIWPA